LPFWLFFRRLALTRLWPTRRGGRCAFPHGQYQTAGAWVAIRHPFGVHSRHGADHVASRSNRSNGLLLRLKEYVEPRIGRASERGYTKARLRSARKVVMRCPGLPPKAVWDPQDLGQLVRAGLLCRPRTNVDAGLLQVCEPIQIARRRRSRMARLGMKNLDKLTCGEIDLARSSRDCIPFCAEIKARHVYLANILQLGAFGHAGEVIERGQASCKARNCTGAYRARPASLLLAIASRRSPRLGRSGGSTPTRVILEPALDGTRTQHPARPAPAVRCP
jgi:hypothetical protein